jgi:hypothetical protein
MLAVAEEFKRKTLLGTAAVNIDCRCPEASRQALQDLVLSVHRPGGRTKQSQPKLVQGCRRFK